MGEEFVPCTIDGVENVQVPVTDLRKVDGIFEDDNEITKYVEYYKGDVLVHRSVHVHLKQGLGSMLEQGAF